MFRHGGFGSRTSPQAVHADRPPDVYDHWEEPAMSRRLTAIICSLAVLAALIGCDQKPSPPAKPVSKTPVKLPPGLAEAAGQPAAQTPQQPAAQPVAGA
jgi:hypothetical protein